MPKNWLAAFNYYRAIAELPPVAENLPGQDFNYSYWDRWHSEYMILNQDGIGHYETPGTPMYAAEGDAAAKTSNLAWTGDVNATALWGIEGWLTAPFHGLQMLDPRLEETGFGLFRDAAPDKCDIDPPGTPCFRFGTALDHDQGDNHPVPAGVDLPIMFPGEGKTIYLDRYGQAESPNPFERGPCTAYDGDQLDPSTHTGPPIYLIQGPGTEIHYEQAGSSFMRGTTPLEFCAFDGDLYDGGPNVNWFGNALEELNAVFLFPRKPLKSQAEYTVTINTTGVDKTWSFETGDILAPKSRVKKPGHQALVDQDNLKKIAGTSSGDTTRVDVAIARVKNNKCRFMNGAGNFGDLGDCFDQVWHKARGKTDWAFTLPKKLPATFNPSTGDQNGFYYAFSRGRDEVDNIEDKFAFGRNYIAFHVSP